MLDFLSQWWGILGVVVLMVIAYFIYGFEVVKGHIVKLIFIAESEARKKCLETGKQKFEWVLETGYTYLPAALKLFISKELFALIVQGIFDKIVDWAEAQELR
jgi:hypothetical protein